MASSVPVLVVLALSTLALLLHLRRRAAHAPPHVMPHGVTICSHRGVSFAGAVPRTLADWASSMAALEGRGVTCADVDVVQVEGGGEGGTNALLVGHPTLLATSTPAPGDAALSYAQLLEWTAAHPAFSFGVELKPPLLKDAGEGRGGGSASSRVDPRGLVSVVQAAVAHGVAGRLSFQLSLETLDALPAHDVSRLVRDDGVTLALPLRQWRASSRDTPPDPHCGVWGGAGAAGQVVRRLTTVGILMPAAACLASPAVRQAIAAWRGARQGAGLPHEVHVWVVDDCAGLRDLVRLAGLPGRDFPVTVDRVISNAPGELSGGCRG